MSIRTELDKTALYLRNARNAVIGRGGEISATAGFKDLPEAITNIPNDQTLAWQTVESNSKRVTVPSGVLPMAQIKKIGGMSYKSTNILKLKTLNETQNGVTITTNPDGSYTLNGVLPPYDEASSTWFGFWDSSEDFPYDTIKSGQTITLRCDGYENVPEDVGFDLWVSSDYVELEDGELDFDLETTIGNHPIQYSPTGDHYFGGISLVLNNYHSEPIVLNNLIFTITVNAGTEALPYEPYFEGIRDSKTTSIVSEGANLLNLTEFIGKSVTANGGTLTVGADGGVTGSGIPTSSVSLGYGKTVDLPLDATITISASGTFSNMACSLYFRDANGTQIFSVGVNSTIAKRTINLADYPTLSYITYEVKRSDNNQEMSGTAYFAVNEGKAAQPYKPYVGTLGITNIPEAVRNLEGYGLGINADYYNYVEWRDGRCYFHRNVYEFTYTKDGDIGREPISGQTTTRFYIRPSSSQELYKRKSNATAEETPILSICDRLDYVGYYDDREGYSLDKGSKAIHFKANCTSIEEAAEWLDGTKFILALEEPEVIDITDLMTVDNHIAVEGGGTIEFNNEYGYDIPNEINYLFNTAGG